MSGTILDTEKTSLKIIKFLFSQNLPRPYIHTYMHTTYCHVDKYSEEKQCMLMGCIEEEECREKRKNREGEGRKEYMLD